MAKVIEFHNWCVINNVHPETEPFFFYLPQVAQFYENLYSCDAVINGLQPLEQWRVDEILESCKISTWHDEHITKYPNLKNTTTISFYNENIYGCKINSEVILDNDALSVNFDQLYAEFLSRKTPEFLSTVAEFDEEISQTIAKHNLKLKELHNSRHFFITKSLKS